MLICECQLRDHEARPAPGVPDAVVREAAHVHPEPANVVEAHVRNEELIADFEQEEGPVTIRAKPLAVLLDELDDLGLREAKTVEVVAHAVPDLGECPVLDQLVDSGLRLLRGFGFNVATPALEVAVDVAGKGVLRFRNGCFPVRFVELQGFSAGDEFDVAGDVLGQLGKLLLHQSGDGGDNLIAAGTHAFDVLLVEDAVLGELAELGASPLTGGIGDQGHAGFDLAVTDFFD